MIRVQIHSFKDFDWILIINYLLLVSIGWFSIYAVEINSRPEQIFISLSNPAFKQLLWIGISLVIASALLIVAQIHYINSQWLYWISILLLVGLFIFGKSVKGATSWYQLGGLGLQPSEFAKFTTAAMLAHFLSKRPKALQSLFNRYIVAFIIGLPVVLIMLQPDIGSALVFSSFLFVLYREGLSAKWLLRLLGIVLIFICYLFWGFTQSSWILSLVIAGVAMLLYWLFRTNLRLRLSPLLTKTFVLIGLIVFCLKGIDYTYHHVLRPHHRDRFDILLGKKHDLQGVGYNLNQSLLCISSGRFYGKGFAKGDRTQGGFVPEQHTDYIITYIAEEWGFIGVCFVWLLYMVLIMRVIYKSNKQIHAYNRIYGYAVASILLLQCFINISMCCGLLPTIGIPLPLISYGGSSMIGFSLLIFYFIKLDRDDTYYL